MSAKSPIAEACQEAREARWKLREETADKVAWALVRELKGNATDRERERLAEAIREFLT